MKNSINFIGLFCTITLLGISSHANPSIPYTIKGVLISMHPDVSQLDETPSETAGEKSESSSEEQAIEPLNLSDAVLTTSREVTNDEGEVETVVLLEEHFDGTFDYYGMDESLEEPEVDTDADPDVSS
ncbi:MAG: hypothetical protein F4W92_01720 [Gammaproteobacteria bacterium]|nr:hypothetical protein [Gammaproteobacteria bacterium]